MFSALVNPAFGGPDEIHHFGYIEHLRRTRSLPVSGAGLGELHQPPLDYIAGALLTAWLPVDVRAAESIQPNPYSGWHKGDVGVDNKSQFVHTPAEAFPFAGLGLRLHLLRLLSALLGIVAVWEAGRLVLIWQPGAGVAALLATAVAGFPPQYLFVALSRRRVALADRRDRQRTCFGRPLEPWPRGDPLRSAQRSCLR